MKSSISLVANPTRWRGARPPSARVLAGASGWCPSVDAHIGPNRLPSWEAGIQLVPEGDLRLPGLPAQVNLVVVYPAGEIDQSNKVVLQLDAEVTELLLVFD